jgi:3-oxoacyl-[acyl-carrier-protein] synthase-1
VPAPDVVVVRVGMVTAVGLSTAETAASVRAATMRFSHLDWLDHRFEPFTVAAIPDDGLPGLSPEVAKTTGLSMRDARLLRLGARALAECMGPAGRGTEKRPLVLALPEPERQRPLDARRFLKLFGMQTGGIFDPTASATLTLGRAGGLVAVARAAAIVRSGKAKFAVAGGLDSYVDLYTLGTLDLEKRVKSGAHLDGFIPGEGAAFLLLASPQAAAAAHLPSLAVISEAAEGFEKGHLGSKETYLGEGLALTIQSLVQSAPPPRPFVSVWSSMNGESHWAKEWGVAFLRSRDAFEESHAMYHPADCFGDTGAAAGALLAGLASLDAARGPALAYASSDFGPRASLSILPAGGI